MWILFDENIKKVKCVEKDNNIPGLSTAKPCREVNVLIVKWHEGSLSFFHIAKINPMQILRLFCGYLLYLIKMWIKLINLDLSFAMNGFFLNK